MQEAFSNQYICSRQPLNDVPNSKLAQLGGWSLHYGDRLPTETTGACALVGEALDWTAPTKSNAEILRDLAGMTPEDAIAHTNRLSGRWAFMRLDADPFVISDGGGTMPVIWTAGQFASSAKLLAACNPAINLKKREKFDRHRTDGWHSGFAFIATDTEAEGTVALLPNHILQPETGDVRRIYPTARMAPRSLADSVDSIAECLRGIVGAAAQRAPLAIGLTSGYDSRLIAAVVATMPDVKERTLFFTIQDEHATPEGHDDIEGAQWIAAQVGVPHVTVVSSTASPEMQDRCRRSEGMVAPRFEDWAELSQRPDFKGRLVVSSWASEICRAYFTWPNSENAGAEEALGCSGLKAFPEFLDEAQRWASSARTVQDDFGLTVTDLIYWELRVGRWNAAAFNILGQGAWWMTLYTCRDLFERMMAIPVGERGYRGDKLYPAVIAKLFPVLLDRPFTQYGLKQRAYYFFQNDLRHGVARGLMKLGAYDFAKAIKKRISG